MIIVGDPLTSEEYRVMLAHFAIADLGYVPAYLSFDAWHAPADGTSATNSAVSEDLRSSTEPPK